MKLSTLGYQIDGDKNKCSHVAIKPLNDKEKDILLLILGCQVKAEF